jgi:hypothetical protein
MQNQAGTDHTIDAMDGIYSGIDRAKGLLAVLVDGLHREDGPVAVVPYGVENLLSALYSIGALLDGAHKNADIINHVALESCGFRNAAVPLSN